MAPPHAEPIAPENKSDDGKELPTVTCYDCGFQCGFGKLLGVDPEETTTLWCPQCGSINWVYD